MADKKKKGIFDTLRSVVEQAVTPPAPEAPARPRRREPGPLAVDGYRSSDAARAQPTAGLAAAPSTGRLQQGGPSEAELSPRRLAMARDYANGERKIPEMNDPAFMYKVVADERAYQTRLLVERRKGLERHKGDAARSERLKAQIAEGQRTLKMLFQLLKQITGRQGATGGTDFLTDPP